LAISEGSCGSTRTPPLLSCSISTIPPFLLATIDLPAVIASRHTFGKFSHRLGKTHMSAFAIIEETSVNGTKSRNETLGRLSPIICLRTVRIDFSRLGPLLSFPRKVNFAFGKDCSTSGMALARLYTPFLVSNLPMYRIFSEPVVGVIDCNCSEGK
jgi:hypothetical protein